MLEAALALRLGALELRLELAVGSGEVLALVGPNGAGKTTTLRVLAGALQLTAGRIELDGKVLDEPAGGVLVPAEERSVGMVFQDRLLFPHLSALDNAAFERVGAADWADVRPGALSGGQAQRVALARALVVEPRLLLLDEPLAAMDAGARLELRAELGRQLREFKGAALLVTHDPDDARALATRSLRIAGGRAES